MTFTPDSKVRLCSVPFSDYTNVLSFKNNDEARANYFISKTVYNLTDVNGYSYVKGNGAIRVNKSKDSLYNVNYMMYRNDHFGSKWFYAFVDSLEYINANVTEIRFSTDVWQTWESALNFHESFIVRQHIPKGEDTIGANLQPEGFTNLKYVEEKLLRNDLVKYHSSDKSLAIIVCCTEYPDGDSGVWRKPPKCLIDEVQGTLAYIPFISTDTFFNFLSKFINESGKSESIVNIFTCPIECFYDQTSGTFNFKEGTPLGVSPNVSVSNVWETNWIRYRIPKMNKINIGTHGTTVNHYARNNKMYTFPFTKVILTNNSGSSLTFRQEFFDGTPTEGEDIVFDVRNTVLQPVTSYCHPANYREGDYVNGLSLTNYPMLPWYTDTYSRWLTLNQNTLKYQQLTPIINLGVSNFNNMISSATGGASSYISSAGQIDSARTTQGQFSGIAGAIANRVSSLGTQINNTVNNLVSTGEQIWSFYAKKADMELQPNLSAGNYNANNILQMNQKLNFRVMFQRVCFEQFKQIDNYFDKFGYAINDFKAVNYNNRSNFDYIETSQVVIDGDVPEDDMDTIKNIFNSGVRIWHDTSTFLNYSAYEYNTSDKK